MVPPEAFSISAAQACVAGTSGCAGGTHSDTFMLTVLSCAKAGVTPKANSNAKNAFLIDIVSPHDILGFDRPLQILLYDIIIIASACGRVRVLLPFKPIIVRGASIADKSSNHWRRSRGIAAGPTAARLRDRQFHPGTPDAGLCARPHPRRPFGRRHSGAARSTRRRHPRPSRGPGA